MLVHILIFRNSESDLTKRTVSAFSGCASQWKGLMGNAGSAWRSWEGQGSGQGQGGLRGWIPRPLSSCGSCWNGHLTSRSRAVGEQMAFISPYREARQTRLRGLQSCLGAFSLCSTSAPCPFRDELRLLLFFLCVCVGGTTICLGIKN